MDHIRIYVCSNVFSRQLSLFKNTNAYKYITSDIHSSGCNIVHDIVQLKTKGYIYDLFGYTGQKLPDVTVVVPAMYDFNDKTNKLDTDFIRDYLPDIAIVDRDNKYIPLFHLGNTTVIVYDSDNFKQTFEQKLNNILEINKLHIEPIYVYDSVKPEFGRVYIKNDIKFTVNRNGIIKFID